MKIPNFLKSILPKRKMNILAEILNVLKKHPHIHFSVENNSPVWRGDWVVTLNMMDAHGSHFFHNSSLNSALKEALKFLKEYKSI